MTNNKYTFTGLTGVMATITGAFYYQKYLMLTVLQYL